MSRVNILKALEEANENYILALEDAMEGYEMAEMPTKIGRTRFNVLRNKNGYTVLERDDVILSIPPFFTYDYMAKIILTAMKY